MIIVTGTKRSGTSLWMQILTAAGFQYIGRPFSKDWEQSIKPANPHGFFESQLRGGIYHKTNPHPKSGDYLPALDTQKIAVKIFVPGLIRTERAYIHRVVASIRHWKEYWSSIDRLNALEHAHHKTNPPPHLKLTPEELALLTQNPLHPVLEWWADNYQLIRDYSVRRYPFHCLAYELLLKEAQEHIPPILSWLQQDLPVDLAQLGGRPAHSSSPAIDVQKGVAAVVPSAQTQHRPELSHLSFPFDDAKKQLFDDLYDCFTKDCQLPSALIKALNRCDAVLQPEIKKHRLEHQIRIRKILVDKELHDHDLEHLKRH